MRAPIATTAGTSGVVFRLITPVFLHRIDEASRFTHAGRSGADSFTITLLPYQAFRTEVFPSYDQEMQDGLQENQAHFWEVFPIGASHFLLTDVTRTGVIEPNNLATIPDYRKIAPAAPASGLPGSGRARCPVW